MEEEKEGRKTRTVTLRQHNAPAWPPAVGREKGPSATHNGEKEKEVEVSDRSSVHLLMRESGEPGKGKEGLAWEAWEVEEGHAHAKHKRNDGRGVEKRKKRNDVTRTNAAKSSK